MQDNLLYNGGEDERSVVNNIRNALNRLSSEARANFFHELAGISVSAPIEREHSTTIETPDTTVLMGLAGDPAPVSLGDLSERPGGGPVDLYADDTDEAIAIEAKLGDSLNQSQLERYATALEADKVVTVTWTDIYRTLESINGSVHKKRQFLVEDSLNYIESLGLHQNSVTFDRYWGEQDGYKYIRATENQVIFYTNDHEMRGETDRRELSWEQFQRLFNDIEERHGKDVLEGIFVDIAPPAKFFSSDTVLGEIDSIRTDNNLLRLFYQDSDNAVKLREIQQRDESPPAPGSPAGPNETYAWLMVNDDQQEMLRSNPRGVREQIFIKREWEDSLL